MTYAQGMSAQMTAAVSIGLASYTGMPVSTTHVLSSSVAGTMVVDGGGLQRKTVTSILMAGIYVTGGDYSFRRAVLAFPEDYLSQMGRIALSLIRPVRMKRHRPDRPL